MVVIVQQSSCLHHAGQRLAQLPRGDVGTGKPVEGNRRVADPAGVVRGGDRRLQAHRRAHDVARLEGRGAVRRHQAELPDIPGVEPLAGQPPKGPRRLVVGLSDVTLVRRGTGP